mmetsp:Transcript_1879/g.6182  ORF Transcript_1879/g.6182 Transcript_1879/m.6182 type:complete len:217 (+) Transcript_1879:168-818(+)
MRRARHLLHPSAHHHSVPRVRPSLRLHRAALSPVAQPARANHAVCPARPKPAGAHVCLPPARLPQGAVLGFGSRDDTRRPALLPARERIRPRPCFRRRPAYGTAARRKLRRRRRAPRSRPTVPPRRGDGPVGQSRRRLRALPPLHRRRHLHRGRHCCRLPPVARRGADRPSPRYLGRGVPGLRCRLALSDTGGSRAGRRAAWRALRGKRFECAACL